jgi:poly-beta-1,6-N-acetyl-D-glucosamine biosynthesis protein PgaD
MTNPYPIIDLRHQFDWRRRVLSEALTLSLWAGAGILFTRLWRSTAHSSPLKIMMERAAGPIEDFVFHSSAILSGTGLAVRHSHTLHIPLFHNHWIATPGAHHASAYTHVVAISGIDHGVLSFVAIVLATATFLLLWNLSSALGRRRTPSQNEREVHAIKLCPQNLQVGQDSQICTVHHDEDGQIIAIARHTRLEESARTVTKAA